MSWHYKFPSTFPPHFPNALREAAAAPETPFAIASKISRHMIKAEAEKFRWFRWCVREEPKASPDLFALLESHNYRTTIQQDSFGYILYVVARPTKLSEFIRLNPELASEIIPECQ